MFAEHHHGYLWAVALLLNMIGFSVVAAPLWLLSRYRLAKWGAISQHLLDSILGGDALHLIPRNKRPVAPD